MRPFVIILIVTILLFVFAKQFDGSDANGYLRVSDKVLLDGKGEPLILKGFNVAFKDFNGTLGEQDIKRIADTGANNIRLVIDYRQLESSPFEYDEKNFALLDTILSWCEKYEVYVILDMHLAPGIQNPHDFVVHREKVFSFWEESQYQDRFYALWVEIARRYAGSRIIVGYDLLNEGVAPSEDRYRAVMSMVASRIRKVDPHHVFIVEEALLPGGARKLLPIDDDNVIYSVHFFYPPQFTFYTTTRQRTITRYPGEMSVSGEAVDAATSPVITGTGDWRRITLTVAPPSSADIVQVLVLSDEQHGRAWFDDIQLRVDGLLIDLPAPLVANNSFEIDYPGISWNTNSTCAEVTDVTAKTGTYSMGFAQCDKPAVVLSSPIAVEGNSYTLSAWVKTDNAQGNNRLALSWRKAKTLSSFNKNTLRDRLDYALRFRAWYGAPVYIGEFTVHANPSKDSVKNYLKDMLDILESERLHWSYWTYYSEFPGIGMYTGNHPYLARPESLQLLVEAMGPKE